MKLNGMLTLANCAFVLLLACSGCGKPAPIATTRPPAIPTVKATAKPTIKPAAKPGATSAPTKNSSATTDPYETWSTTFAGLASPAGAGISGLTQESHPSDEQFSVETANVNSGGKAVKDSGTVDSRHPLITSLKIRDMTGRDSFDLSDKTLTIEMYVPADSPIPLIHIALSSQNQKMFVRWNAYVQKGRWYTYSVDLSMLLALGSWQFEDWLHPAGITSAEVVNLLKNVESIQVYGTVGWNQLKGPAYLLIDQLGWSPSGPLSVQDPSIDSLAKYASSRNLLLGSHFGMVESSDPQFLHSLLQDFNFVLSEEPILWPASEPAGDNFDAFVQQPVDNYLDTLSERLGAPAMHYLVYYPPDWLKPISYEQTKTILENLVCAQVIRHKGKTRIWFLFNEALRYDIGWTYYQGLGLKDRKQSPQNWGNNYSPFAADPSDVSLIEDAFRVAHESDPQALLYLIDGASEEKGQAKADALYNLAARLVDDNVPVNGVGLEGHLFIGPDNKVHDSALLPYALAFDATNGLTGIAANVERYQALGLDVVFSEADVPIYLADIDSSPAGQQKLADRLQIQAEVYRSLLHITLTHSNMPAFALFSGGADRFSWLQTDPDPVKQRYGAPGIFDVDFKPKPAYYALLNELKNR
jgi:endo-1,4-beta-xylanase